MHKELLLQEAASHVEQLYGSCKRSYLIYHNLDHTRNVVQHAKKIAIHFSLSKSDCFVLLMAAWFHDTGQLTGDMAVHEETSVQFMKDFFFDKEINKKLVNEIVQCIMATKMPVAPNSLLKKIICDADTWHLGTNDFHRLDVLVWKELELRFQKPIENQVEKSIQFLKSHHFYTDYCIDKLSAGKKKNIRLLNTLL